MKQRISIYFLAIYLLSATPLHELLKLPMLVQHFMEHKAENSQISFCEFLEMHYAAHSTHDADHKHDGKLPFKSCHCAHHAVVLHCTLAFLPNLCNSERVYPTEKKQRISRYRSAFSCASLGAIWQPPKFC
jgi:hypothetical protein